MIRVYLEDSAAMSSMAIVHSLQIDAITFLSTVESRFNIFRIPLTTERIFSIGFDEVKFDWNQKKYHWHKSTSSNPKLLVTFEVMNLATGLWVKAVPCRARERCSVRWHWICRSGAFQKILETFWMILDPLPPPWDIWWHFFVPSTLKECQVLF